MRVDSVEAYDPPERVRRYDADMDIMHPLRLKMIDVALELFPETPTLIEWDRDIPAFDVLLLEMKKAAARAEAVRSAPARGPHAP